MAKAFGGIGTAIEYRHAVNQVFGDISTALYQFPIYQSIQDIPPALIKQIQLVLVSFIKLCAYVVSYRQGGTTRRLAMKLKSIFDEEKGLAGERRPSGISCNSSLMLKGQSRSGLPSRAATTS